MPKNQSSPIRLYFMITSENNAHPESKCRECGIKMKGNHASNMVRHVRRSHPHLYQQYVELRGSSFGLERRMAIINSCLSSNSSGAKLSNETPVKPKKIKTENEDKTRVALPLFMPKIIDKDEIIDCCVEIVTVNGRPFSTMNDSGFRKLLQIVFSKDVSSVIDGRIIKSIVIERAALLRQTIAEFLKFKVISLKLDCVTHCTRSFLGIHAHCYNENEPQHFTLAIIEINVKQTVEELSAIVWNTLSLFSVEKHQIYGIVIDSGSNFPKLTEFKHTLAAEVDTTVKTENESTSGENEVETSGDKSRTDPHQIEIFLLPNAEGFEHDVQVITIYDDIEEDDDDLDTNTTDIIVEKLHLDFTEDDATYFTSEMKCAANALQSAVNVVFKTCPVIIDTVKEAKGIIRRLNTPSVVSTLRKINISIPTCDFFSSGWKSICYAMEQLLELKMLCCKLGIVSEESIFWTNLEHCVKCLQPCKTVADMFQKDQLPLTEVYKLWFCSLLETSKIDSTITDILSKKMRETQDTLLDNITIISALFLDPRFNNVVLNDKQKEEAIAHLSMLYQKILQLRSLQEETEKNNEMGTAVEEDELEIIFKQQEHDNNRNKQKNTSKRVEFLLRNFCENEPRLKTSENIFNFWELKKAQYPEVYDLANVFLSVPATQKTVGVLMAQMQYILDVERDHIESDLLNDVLLMRSNASVCIPHLQ